MQEVTLTDLLKAGLHFGHQTQRWHPKMKPFLFGVRNGIHIIDLEKTAAKLQEAYNYVYDLSKSGGTVLFVGTKKQAAAPIAAAAKAANMPFVTERWLGGTITNFKTISAQIKKLNQYEQAESAGELGKYTKKERLMKAREMAKLKKIFDGMRAMTEIPQAIFVVDVKNEHIAIAEAKARNIKIIAMVDSNASPEGIDYPIPANDDAARGVALVANVLADAVNRGRGVTAQPEATPVVNEAPAATPVDVPTQAA